MLVFSWYYFQECYWVLPIIFTHSSTVAMLFISLAVGFSMSANAAFYAVNVDIDKERAATSLGVMDARFAIAGFLSPTITGWIVSMTGDFTSAFWLLSILAFSSVVIVFIFHRPDSTEHLSSIN